MNYIILDLEFNQSIAGKVKDAEYISMCPFEIIQIGALKLNEALQNVATLDRLVKPTLYRELHPFIKEMTSIDEVQLRTAKNFKAVYDEFSELTFEGDNVLCIWGMSDIKELFRNAEYYGLNTKFIPRQYINLQAYVSQYLCCPKGTSIGLRNAVELLNIPVTTPFHNAFNDACYTTEIFKRIYSENLRPKTYNPYNHRTASNSRNSKKIVDSESLIQQFIKMFGREMTEDEKTIIKLAYMMGRSNQFQIDPPDK